MYLFKEKMFIIVISTSLPVKEFPSDDVRRSSIVFAVTRRYQSTSEQKSTRFLLFFRFRL